jgi:hypothetical protein
LFLSFWTLVGIIISVPVAFRRIFNRLSTSIGVLVWLCLNARQFIDRPFSYFVLDTPLMPSAHVPNVLFLVFVTHTMLPLSRSLAVALATATTVLELVLSGALTDVTGLPLVLQVSNFRLDLNDLNAVFEESIFSRHKIERYRSADVIVKNASVAINSVKENVWRILDIILYLLISRCAGAIS